MKVYFTFGQIHRHKVGARVFDKNCVCVIEAEDEDEGRKRAFQAFGDKWAFSYPENEWDHDDAKTFFPRGYIELK